ncbi:hypothetical protein G2912_21360 [Paraburkholderia aspalathi]|uniref:Uncharacterized protein n=1 Tax=Paraburkholderia nemoris TaxID=2793076 RepID=A0ABM8S4A9_9BURK|nr:MULTISPECIES: hypothetical protein [Paraburkholderia]MBK3812908.1 hypothetical protein [Paraburkholderia aspalathi]CAE6788611.1 hypothetical protein R69776_04648 [Paraburkholderia nemoris]
MQSTGSGEPSWRRYEELFEAGVVYPTPDGVSVELRTREQGGADVVVRLPVGTARQPGLHASVPPGLRERACDAGKS